MPTTIESLLGAADNLHEPIPAWNRAGVIIGLTVSFSAIASLCIFARLYTRFCVLKMAGWDDYFMILMTTVGGIGIVTMCILPSAGLGRHFILLTQPQQQRYLLLFYLADGSFITTVALIKLSLLLQYLRIFEKGVQRWLCLGTMAIVIPFAGIYSFMAWFPCLPVIEAYWDWTLENRRCYSYGSLYVEDHYHTFLSQAIMNMFLDIVILLIPTPLLFRQGTEMRTRLGLIGLLILGAAANILAGIRLGETIRHRSLSYPTFDHSWYAPVLCILGMLEVNLGCISASVPVFWPVLKGRLDAIFVTREIKISVTERSEDIDRQRPESLYSNNGSERALRLWGFPPVGPSTGDHYKDSFVLEQVDPLRQKTMVAVDARVTTGKPSKKLKETSKS
ncbi:hypothetical protein S7711_10015 [Stachybotrys chartarum IBT 7711]|uniref:Rhodopsin domain-containing protein n=1 Tax=Stachybotrys chartarum (strain CBS 109288 / IBT 7711) TaxID=1280523 RepID=A0A084AQH7_STACB|nr:hypothetical protein S7711_10015 [Stachybotrys chartarum IBT 7711]